MRKSDNKKRNIAKNYKGKKVVKIHNRLRRKSYKLVLVFYWVFFQLHILFLSFGSIQLIIRSIQIAFYLQCDRLTERDTRLCTRCNKEHQGSQVHQRNDQEGVTQPSGADLRITCFSACPRLVNRWSIHLSLGCAQVGLLDKRKFYKSPVSRNEKDRVFNIHARRRSMFEESHQSYVYEVQN